MNYLLTGQETERLRFRKLEPSDFDTWMELLKDEKTAELLCMNEYKTAEERCQKWFEATFNRYEKGLGGQNVLISKADNQLVGQCGLLVREVENHFEIEVAYSILPEHRMKGYAFESAKKCRDFAFQHAFHDRLISLIVPENNSSKNVALKNGMTWNRQVEYSGRKVDLFQITKTEWEKGNRV